MHAAAHNWLTATFRTLTPPPRRVVEYGGQDLNATARGMVLRLALPNAAWTSVDQMPGLGVDVVTAAEDYTPSEPPDLVVCAEVLEHAPNTSAAALCRQAHAILAPKGTLLVTCATEGRAPHSGRTGAPGPERGEFYRNVSPTALATWLAEAGFADVECWVETAHHDLYAVARKGNEDPI